MGSQLLAHLARDQTVEQILGFDVHEPHSKTEKLKFFRIDIRNSAIIPLLQTERVDTLVHLAFIMNPVGIERQSYDIDVNGARNLINAVKSSCIKKVILSSSTSVYGAHADNPNPIDEGQPCRPNPGNLYAAHKVAMEKLFTTLHNAHQDITLTVFRICMILGPHMDNNILRAARVTPGILTVKKHNPHLQFIHEADVVRALLCAVRNDMPGIFNLVGHGSITMERLCKILHKIRIPLNFTMLRFVHGFFRVLRIPLMDFESGWLHFFRASCIADSTKLEHEFAFRPSFSTEDALRSYVEVKKLSFKKPTKI